MAATPSPNLTSSRRSSGGDDDLVSLSSSSGSEEETSSGETDHHRSSVNPDTPDLAPPTSSTPSRQRNSSSSQSGSAITSSSAAAQGEGPVSESPVARGQVQQKIKYELFDPDQLTKAEYENKGLLFAKSSKAKFNVDLLKPADEVAEEASCPEEPASIHSVEVQHVAGSKLNNYVILEVLMQPSFQIMERRIAPIDPGVVLELERSAHHVAGDLVHVMENLRNSLHAMTVCTKQSMQLHKESVNNIHMVVDANVKAMYSFMAKFDELRNNFTPVQQLAQQINEMDENLKVLERTFAKP